MKTEDLKVISTILYTQGTQKVNLETEKELEIPDPPLDVATAAINENKQKGDNPKD
jgi:hypothetical protein